MDNLMSEMMQKRRQVADKKDDGKRHVSTEKQFYGLWAVQELDMPKEYIGQIIKMCNNRLKHEIEGAVAATKRYVTDNDSRHKFLYFAKVMRSIK